MAAAMAFILYVVSSGGLPDLTALAAFPSQATCQAAADKVNAAVASGQDAKIALCFSADSLDELAKKNNVPGK